MEPDVQSIWRDYGLEELQAGLDSLFPQNQLSLQNVLENVLSGNITGVIGDIFLSLSQGIIQQLAGFKNIFVWLILLGIAASVMSHFADVFQKSQIADLSYYFMYLLLAAVLLKCFIYTSQVGLQVIENIVHFITMSIPAFLLAVGVATGTTTVSAYSFLLVWIIYGVQQVLGKIVYKMISAYIVITLLNGIWIEERLALLADFLKKLVLLVLKVAMGLVTGISVFQTLITPVIDSAKSSLFQKALSSIPGIGDVSDGVIGMVLGSALIIKNTIGVVVLIALLVLCAIPMLQIFAMAWMLRVVAAVLGVISDKRLVECTNKVGEGCMLMLRTAATALVLFFIVICMLAMATNRGF